MSTGTETATPSGAGLPRIGVYSLLLNILLSALKGGLALASGSLALTADSIHSLVDVFASLAVIIGLRLSNRKTKTFPYGLYKVENVVSVVIALLIFLAGYEIVREVITAHAPETFTAPWLVVGVLFAVAAPFAFSRFEARIGRATGSPSVLADSRHFQTDVFSSLLVLIAVVGIYFHVALDRYAALGVVVFIIHSGWGLLVDGMRVLLDASIDPQTLAQIRQILGESPMVAEVKSITGRNSGRYRFIEAEITVRTHDLARAHSLSQRLEDEIREKVPRVERVIIHYEPRAKSAQIIAVPLSDRTGTISPHFGEAPYFALVHVRLSDGEITRQEVIANPHDKEEKAKGIHVVEWLALHKVDEVLLREDLRGMGADYALSASGIESRLTSAEHLGEALKELGQEKQ